MTLLSEMGDLLECCGTTQEACAVVAQSVQKLLPEALSGTLYLFRSSRNLVEAAVRWGNDNVSAPLFSPESCWGLRRGQPQWSERAGGISCSHLAEGSTNKCLCVPMVGQGDTLGILHLEFAGDAEEIRQGQLQKPVPVPGVCRTLNSAWRPPSRGKSLFHWPACVFARPCVTNPFAIR